MKRKDSRESGWRRMTHLAHQHASLPQPVQVRPQLRVDLDAFRTHDAVRRPERLRVRFAPRAHLLHFGKLGAARVVAREADVVGRVVVLCVS